jgi:hypothetical protein
MEIYPDFRTDDCVLLATDSSSFTLQIISTCPDSVNATLRSPEILAELQVAVLRLDVETSTMVYTGYHCSPMGCNIFNWLLEPRNLDNPCSVPEKWPPPRAGSVQKAKWKENGFDFRHLSKRC